MLSAKIALVWSLWLAYVYKSLYLITKSFIPVPVSTNTTCGNSGLTQCIPEQSKWLRNSADLYGKIHIDVKPSVRSKKGLNRSVGPDQWFNLQQRLHLYTEAVGLSIAIPLELRLQDITGHFMGLMKSSNGNILRITSPLWGEFAGNRWIPLTKASDAEFLGGMG